jgi:hypothetical protein
MRKDGRPLTKTQKAYLREIVRRHVLSQGWGGYSSTLTVRILEEHGFIRLREGVGRRWVASPLEKGYEFVKGET